MRDTWRALVMNCSECFVVVLCVGVASGMLAGSEEASVGNVFIYAHRAADGAVICPITSCGWVADNLRESSCFKNERT